MVLRPKSLFYSHFGKADNPIEKLQTYKRQLALWTKIAKQGLEKEEDIETIGKRIVENDSALRKAMDYVKVHPVLGDMVLSTSVQGVIDYVARYGNIPEIE